MSAVRAGVALALALVCACAGELHENLPDQGGGASPEVADAGAPAPDTVHFDTDIQTDIDALGCSMVGCHGSSQGGFHFIHAATGADLSANWGAFKARATDGEASKVLVKPTSTSAHGGGARFTKTDAVYQRWLTWIQQGESE